MCCACAECVCVSAVLSTQIPTDRPSQGRPRARIPRSGPPSVYYMGEYRVHSNLAYIE